MKKEWQNYERAMFNNLYYSYRSPDFYVFPDYREVIGLITNGKRQIDVAVFERNNLSRPLIAVESKFHKRRVDVKTVEAFIGMQQDLGSRHAVMIAPYGFSDMAHRRVQGTNIDLITLPVNEADRLNQREIIRRFFTLDEFLHPQMGDALYSFRTEKGYENLIVLMEDLPFEEWGTLFRIYRKIDEKLSLKTIKDIILNYQNADWTFNLVQILDENGWLDSNFIQDLIKADLIDRDLWEYLNEMEYMLGDASFDD
jgi:hypothetical protein